MVPWFTFSFLWETLFSIYMCDSLWPVQNLGGSMLMANFSIELRVSYGDTIFLDYIYLSV